MTKNFLIVERNSTPVTFTKEGDKYILEGIFTQFDTKNNNNRVYEANDFIPHIESLFESIKAYSLLGELDHPSGYEISLKNVSHVIESLRYDKDKNAIIGRIKLLDTTAGKEAKALVDAGVPLHISSRAAGSVTESGKVKMKKLFTYDLVSQPGFSNAILNRINESCGFTNDNENLLFFELPSTFKIEEQNNNNNMMEDAKNFVTKDHLDAYTRDWKQQFESLKEKVSTSVEPNTEINSMFEVLSKTVENLIKHNDSLVEEINTITEKVESVKGNDELKTLVNKLVEHNDSIVEQVNKMENYLNYITESVNDRFKHVDYIVEESNKRFAHVDYLAEMLDKSIEYSEVIAENFNNFERYADYLAENLGNSIKHSDYLAEKLSESIQYSEHIVETVNNFERYADYLAENLANSIKHGDYLAENLENAIKYSEHIVENVNESVYKKSEIITEKKQENTEIITETVNNFNFSDLDNSLKNIISETTKRKVEENTKMNFLNYLLENQKKEFAGLSLIEKENVISVFESRTFNSPKEAQLIFATINTPKEDSKWIVDMPAEYKPIWNSLTEAQKDVFRAQAALRLLESNEQISHFWKTRDLRKFDRKDNIILENQNTEIPSELDLRLQKLEMELKKRFNR